MPVNPQFLAARAAEQRNRLHSYLPYAEPLYLPLTLGRVARVPLMHFTKRMEDELAYIGSPFVHGGKVTRADLFRFLWRQHPRFLRPDGTLANQKHRRASLLDRLASAAASLRLAWICGRLAWPLALVNVRARMELVNQDDPAVDATTSASGAAAPHCETDDLCRYFAKHGYTREEVIDAPVAYLLQFFRSEQLAQPDGELNVIDRSDALLA